MPRWKADLARRFGPGDRCSSHTLNLSMKGVSCRVVLLASKASCSLTLSSYVVAVPLRRDICLWPSRDVRLGSDDLLKPDD